MSGTIKLISKDTNLNELTIRPQKWDVVLNDRPYQVVRIEGYVHTIGGRFHENDYWAYPLDEEMSVNNLIEYNSNYRGALFGIIFEPHNYIKSKWDETELMTNEIPLITRNGKKFLYVYGSLVCAIDMLDKIDTHPIDFHNRDYEKDIIGRKIWYRDQPAIITKYFSDEGYQELMISPDGIDRFIQPMWTTNGNIVPYHEKEIKIDLFDSNIYWLRN